MDRALRNDQLLTQAGRSPIHFWEKEVMKNLPACVVEIEEDILAQLIDNAEDLDLVDYEE